MGKHPSDLQKIEFLTHLQYVSLHKAAQRAGLEYTTAQRLKTRVGELEIEHIEKGLPPPTLEEKIARKKGSGAKPKLTIDDLNEIFVACTLNKKQRKKLQHVVAKELGFDVCRRTIETRLRAKGLNRCKPTKKLALTDIQKAQRYEIAWSRRNWTLEEWKHIIFSDEASIIVSAKRGQQNISRMSDERYHEDCIEVRYNNYSEAMFWGCFTYDYKGPCHIYYPETADQKEEYLQVIQKLNDEEIEAECRIAFDRQEKAKEAKWKSEGKKPPGKRASWEVYWKNHKIKRNGKSRGGVDNTRYTYEVIEPKLIPFWHEIQRQRHNPDELEYNIPSFQFLQDGAPSHSSQWTTRRLKKEGIPIIEHIGNSPDMNAIEGAWMPMRIAITRDWGAPHTLEWTDRAWRGQWEKLSQKKIQWLVARMAAINTLIIEHEGGNEFHG